MRNLAKDCLKLMASFLIRILFVLDCSDILPGLLMGKLRCPYLLCFEMPDFCYF